MNPSGVAKVIRYLMHPRSISFSFFFLPQHYPITMQSANILMVSTIHHKKVSEITLTADGNEELPPPRFLFQFSFTTSLSLQRRLCWSSVEVFGLLWETKIFLSTLAPSSGDSHDGLFSPGIIIIKAKSPKGHYNWLLCGHSLIFKASFVSFIKISKMSVLVLDLDQTSVENKQEEYFY